MIEDQRVGEIGASLALRPVPSSDEWEAAVQQLPHVSPCHTWDWLGIMAAAHGLRFLPLGFYAGDYLIGLAPLLAKESSLYKLVNMGSFLYLSPLISPELLSEALSLLDEYQRRHRMGIINYFFPPDAEVDPAILSRHRFALRSDASLILSLDGRSEEELWAGMQSRGRGSVRTAERSGVTVARSTEDEIKIVFPDILEETFARRQRQWYHPLSTPSLLWDRYKDSPNIRMATAHYMGEPAAILVSLAVGKRTFIWSGGPRYRFRKAQPNAALYWDVIRWARARGCEAVDMGPAPEKGIADFKASFGTVPVPFHVAERVNMQWVAWVHHLWNETQVGRRGASVAKRIVSTARSHTGRTRT